MTVPKMQNILKAATLASLVSACSNTVSPPPAPIVTELNAPASVAPGSNYQLSVRAEDPAGGVPILQMHQRGSSAPMQSVQTNYFVAQLTAPPSVGADTIDIRVASPVSGLTKDTLYVVPRN